MDEEDELDLEEDIVDYEDEGRVEIVAAHEIAALTNGPSENHEQPLIFNSASSEPDSFDEEDDDDEDDDVGLQYLQKEDLEVIFV